VIETVFGISDWTTTGTLLRLPLAESDRQSREELQVIDGDGSVMIWALAETGTPFRGRRVLNLLCTIT
jgi:hypothetical protein